MSNFILLEKKYQMLKNFRSFDLLMEELGSVISDTNSKANWLSKRNSYFNSKPDINIQLLNILST